MNYLQIKINKSYLETTDRTSNKFRKAERPDNNLITTEGIVGNEGQKTITEFESWDDCEDRIDKLTDDMPDKGYDFLFDDDDTNYEPLKKGEWFEVIYTKILPLYKRAILNYPKDHYTYLQLQWTGQGFALGLTKNIEENYCEYITDETFDESDCSLNDVYHILEAIHTKMTKAT
ncbi:WGR domain-containing protein [Olleya sp. Bg11-27]|uniref:WGR domain-containing protein n=1 Tax=Olleya sp. Bg11-27 TaxID=2058135 RepID=UPI000C315B84|nr:WGR domain-containing protein [Olleya sp. Bg11-27]AUC75526.1 hypothetical protein CW732_07495 [Olleya sp. Bg11-27]